MVNKADKADNTLGCYNIFDLREIALKRAAKGLFEFVDRGTEDEVALRNNRAVSTIEVLSQMLDAAGERVLALLGCTSVAALRTAGAQYLHILPGTMRGALQGASNPKSALRVIGSAQPAAGA